MQRKPENPTALLLLSSKGAYAPFAKRESSFGQTRFAHLTCDLSPYVRT